MTPAERSPRLRESVVSTFFMSGALLAALTAGFTPARAQTAAAAACTVTSVTDGDTVRCGDERIRLLLIDAPEMDQGPFGRAAQAFLEAIIPPGADVSLEYDVDRRDRYGRTLAYLYRHDGRMVNAMMARQGFAVPYVMAPNVRHVERVRAAADSARADRIGLWSLDAFECAPADHRAGRCGAAVSVTPRSEAACDPAYPGVCIPPPPPDLDCGDVPHRRFRVLPPDPHRFDGNRDGVGCER